MSDGFNGFLLSAAAIFFAIIGLPGPTAFTSPPAVTGAPRLHISHISPTAAGPAEFERTGSSSFLATCSASSIVLLAGAMIIKRGAVARHVNAPKKMKLESLPRPEKLLESPKFPTWIGSTDGYFSNATKERHAMTWVAKDDRAFEMPTGGVAMMNKGDNLCYFRKKEQAICLSKTLRKIKINDIKIYRIKEDGTVVFMHPLDGLWPENQTSGRPLVNWRPFPCSANAELAAVKWTKYHMKGYEVDPLACMFVYARRAAWEDQESLFPMPQPEGWVSSDDFEEYTKKLKDAIGTIPDLPKIK